MSDNSVSSLKVNDTAYMFGGPPRGDRIGATGGTEVIVKKVGRDYVYVTRTGSKLGRGDEEIKFRRENGLEDVDNYKRVLVVDRAAYLAEQEAQVAYSKLRQGLGHTKPKGIALADIQTAAKLLGITLEN